MINTNEIRIGNWFKHNANWCFRSPSEIKPFIFQWEYRDWYALGECTIRLEDIEPIPLSSEILEKCGAEMYDEENKRYLLEGYYYYDNCLWFGTSQIEVIYLHDLQNLIFALSRKELNYTP